MTTPKFGSNYWVDLQHLMKALRDAGPDDAREGLAALGKPDLSVTVAGHLVPIAWQHAKIGLVEAPAPTPPDGWTFVGLDMVGAEAFLAAMGELVFAARVFRMEDSANLSTSRGEGELLAALPARGLPAPDRNFKVTSIDGEPIASVPDGAWPNRRLAVFYDGTFFHVEKSTDELFKELASDKTNRKAMTAARKDKVVKDHAYRREIQAAGWVVITITDVEWQDPSLRDRLVAQIVAAYHAQPEQPVSSPNRTVS